MRGERGGHVLTGAGRFSGRRAPGKGNRHYRDTAGWQKHVGIDLLRILLSAYPVAEGRELEILRDVSLQLDKGQNAAIVGPSGSGKSTLLAILGALDSPSEGSVTLDGVDPFSLDADQLARFRSDSIGFVFQDHHLLPQCTVLENVLVPLLAHGSAQPDDIKRAKSLLERVGLVDRESHRPAQLSGGERQRTAIARALIRNPKLLSWQTSRLEISTAARPR